MTLEDFDLDDWGEIDLARFTIKDIRVSAVFTEYDEFAIVIMKDFEELERIKYAFSELDRMREDWKLITFILKILKEAKKDDSK